MLGLSGPRDAGLEAGSLTAYLPPLLAERFAAGAGESEDPPAMRLEAAVLFSDISGFTSLVERLDAGGPSGVEEISLLLNEFFARLVGTIEAAGGLVEKFAGDSLLAVWPLRGRPPREVIHSALACALKIQAELLGATPTAGERLSLKIGVGAGGLFHLVAGSASSRWLSLLAGDAVDSARTAAGRCPSGQVAVAEHVAEALDGIAELSARQGGIVCIRSVKPLAAEVAVGVAARTPLAGSAGAQLPPALLHYLAAGHGAWMAGFRRVSVLFVNVASMPLPDAAGAACVQRAVRAIQAEIARWGGVVDDVAEDHAGLTMVGAFGLPQCTHEDDAVRAVQTALGISRQLAEHGLRCAIGVGTGRVFCGEIGGPTRRTYSMVGDTMNRSARLMQMAEGDILCDEATRSEAARKLPFESLGETAVRGKTQTVGLFRPLAPETSVKPRAAAWTVGRDDERTVLRRHLHELHPAAAGRAVVVVGEAGIGKSTLAASFIEEASAQGCRVAAGGADAIDRTTGYRAWQPVFFDLLGFPPEADEECRTALTVAWFEARALRRRAERADATEEIDALTLAPLLNLALGLKLPDNAVVREMPARSRSEAASRLLVEIVAGASADGRLALVIEDCHWLDSASLALIRAVLRGVPGVLLVLLTRPLVEPLAEIWSEFLGSSQAERIDLGPLASDATVALVARRLGVRALPREIGEFLIERSEGHPFFAEEIGYSLRDHGWLQVRDGQCHLDLQGRSLRSVDLPHTMRGVVSARIDRLRPAEQLALKVASVHGREFSLAMLRAIHPVESDIESLPACLERLVAVDLATRVDDRPDRLRFKHAIVQEVAYGQLVFEQRRKLHRRLAKWLSEEDETNFPILAHHWAQADEPLEALHCLDRASDEASRRFAEREVVEFLGKAFALTETHRLTPARLMLGRWHRQLGEAYSHLGRIDDSRKQLAQATRILGWPMPGHWSLLAWVLPGVLLRQAAHRFGLWSPLAVDDAARERVYEVLTAYSLLGEVAFFTNDLAATFFCLVRGANIAEKLGPSPMLAQLYGTMSIVMGTISPRIGESYLRLTSRMIAEFDAPVSQGYTCFTLGIYLGGIGDHPRASEFVETGCGLLREFDAGRRLEEALLSAVYPRLHQGRYAECEPLLAEMRRSADRRGDSQTLGWWKVMRALQLLPTRGASAALTELGDDLETGLDALTYAAAHAASAAAWCRLGDAVRARDHAELALLAIEKRPPVAYTMFLFTSQIAEVFFVLLEQDATPASAKAARIRDRARRACRAMHRMARSFPVARPRADLWQGLWEWTGGRHLRARRCWLRALAGAEKLGLQPDCALAHLHLARCDGPAHAEKAAAIYREIGATAELDMLPRLILDEVRTRTLK